MAFLKGLQNETTQVRNGVRVIHAVFSLGDGLLPLLRTQLLQQEL